MDTIGNKQSFATAIDTINSVLQPPCVEKKEKLRSGSVYELKWPTIIFRSNGQI
jgi:hypothetical protein